MALLFVLLADVGLLAVYWHHRQARRRLDGDAISGFPKLQLTPLTPVAGIPAVPSGPGRARPFPPSKEISSPAAPSSDAPSPPQRGRRAVHGRFALAVRTFQQLQGKERYRNSGVLREWRRDFLSYPDLREANESFWRDGDAVSFVLAALRSPNFSKMLRRYANSRDLQAFLRELLGSPAAMTAGLALLEDRRVLSAAKDLTFPGLPPLGALIMMGQKAGSGGISDPAVVMERMRNDPALRKVLEREGIPRDALSP